MTVLSGVSIKSKIYLIVMSICFITLTLIAIATTLSSYQAAEHALAQRMTITTEAISQNISAAVVFNDTDAAKEILDAYSVDDKILSAEVFDVKGSLVASYESTEIKDEDKEVMINGHDIVFNEVIIGNLKITALSINYRDHLLEVMPSLLVIMLISLVVAFLLAISFQRALSQPILRLHSLVGEVAVKKDYSVRSEVQSTDEVGNLSLMFNTMLEEVEKRDQNLERIVHERTTELAMLAERFKYRAFHDGLTGLPNRDFLDEKYFPNDFDTANRQDHFTLLLIDLDDFKNINDSKGHNFGDALLVSVADVFKKSIRSNDIVCRLGGDEFIIILDGEMTENAVKKVGMSIEDLLKEGVTVNDELVSVSASIGSAFYPENGRSLDTLKQCADIAMYAAKKQGKGQLCFYKKEMQTDVCQRQMVQNDFQRALKRHELCLRFQPKVDARTQSVIGCEVLVRWEHPDLGLLQPGTFINYLEETRRVCELDIYMLRKTCEFLIRFDQVNPLHKLRTAVNLSAHHFRNFQIVEIIQETLADYKLSAERLEFEITEAVLIENSEVASEVLTQIKKLGVRISLDDFGTGYSSLSYLRKLPIDTVKIDLSFIRNMLENERNKQIVRGMISLCNDLELEIVAEGVESLDQLDSLVEMGCHQVQGYYFSKPLDEYDFIKWCDDQEIS